MPAPGFGTRFRWRWPARRVPSFGRTLAYWVAVVVFALGATGARSPCAREAHPNIGDESEHAREYRIKAAFLYNFVRYTTWPKSSFADEKAPIVIEIVGTDPFGAIIDETFEDKLLHSRPIEIRRSKSLPPEIRAHVVFASEITPKILEQLLARSRGKSVLLMGESKGFALSGACGNFFIEDEKVRFEINIDAVGAAELQISSQLLKLARIVRDPPEERR